MTPTTPPISNGTYDLLNNLVVLGLPGLGTFYFAIASIWGLGYGEQVVGTLAALAVVLGVFLKIVKSAYLKSDAPYDGVVLIDTTPEDKDVVRFNLDVDPATLTDQRQLTFKVDAVTNAGPDNVNYGWGPQE